MSRIRDSIIAIALAAIAACSGGNSTSPATTGSLDVTITAPAGVSPSVAIVAPDGSITMITSSQTLNGLAAGSYGVIAQPGVTADPIVGTGYAGAVTGSPATVTVGGTASATVTYTSPWAAAGHLWTTTLTSNTILGFTSAQLSATGAPAAAVTLGNGTSTSGVQEASGIAVDARGGVWYTDLTDTLRYFTAAQVASSTNAAPSGELIPCEPETPAKGTGAPLAASCAGVYPTTELPL